MHKGAVILFVLALLATLFLMRLEPVLSSSEVVENSWVSKASMHQTRYGLGVAVVNGRIYAIGGNTEEEVVGTNEEYDPATDTWVLKTPMPTPRNYFAIAAYQSKIYCIGSGVNEVYDPLTDSWETKTPMPTARYGVQANVVDDKIYLIGGYDPNNSSIRSTINEVYDPATDSWTTKVPMPNITYGCISAVIDTKIYFISTFASMQIYDTATGTWSLGTAPPASVYWGAAVATTGVMAPKRVYALGISGYSPEHFVRVYNPENDMWIFGKSIPTTRSDFGVAVVNDVLYVVGGYTLVYPDKGEGPYTPNLIQYAINEQYTPFEYGTTPPVIDLASPVKQTYNASSVSLDFMVNKPAVWMGYSLDGRDNVTVNGNVTIEELSNGLHNVTVYAEDSLGNMGASEIVSFTVEVPFPTALVVASAVIMYVIGLGLIIYFKKRKRCTSLFANQNSRSCTVNLRFSSFTGYTSMYILNVLPAIFKLSDVNYARIVKN
jgi:hypothetical protein